MIEELDMLISVHTHVHAQVMSKNTDFSFDIQVFDEDEIELYYENEEELLKDFKLLEVEKTKMSTSHFQLINKELGGIGEVSIVFGTDSKPYFCIWFEEDCAGDIHDVTYEYSSLEEMMMDWELI